MKVGGQRHAPVVYPREKTRYQFYRRLVGPQGRSEGVRNISSLSGLDPQTVQPVAKIVHTNAFNILYEYVYNQTRYMSVCGSNITYLLTP
jgi:hypothetical protein